MAFHKWFFTLAPAVLLWSGCSGAPTEVTKEPEKPAEAVTGQSALFKMFQVARTWAPDVMVLKANSILLNEMANAPRGKAGAWEATFYSPSLGKARPYTFSVIEQLPALHKNVFAQQEMAYSGPASAAFPFIAVKTDTDKAYQVALGQAEDYEKKKPGKPILVLLEKSPRHPNPAWRVVWGDSVGTSDFSVFVDASTGEFTERMH
jgi:hypothetical protein